MSKTVYLKDSQDKLMEGINILADAVQSTLGPSGKSVIIHNSGTDPFVTKDGVTVAEEMESSDPVINAGMQYIKKVASKMNIDFGDGTTTVTVICRMLIQLGMELRKNQSNFDEHFFKTQIYKCLEEAKIDVFENSWKLELNDINKIAYTSSNNDRQIADLFQQAYDHSGADGYINIMESVTGESYVKTIDGFVIPMGYIERSYANNSITNFFEATQAKVVLYDGEFNDKKEILELIKNISTVNPMPIIIIAKDFSKEVKGIVEYNNSDRIGVKTCLIKNHFRNNEYFTFMNDLENYTGAVPCKSYDRYDTVVGYANNLIVKEGYTVFGKPGETQNQILEQHLEKLLQASEGEASNFHVEDMKKRASKMRNGVTTLYVGGYSEVELIERKHRVEDAHKACSAALKGNVVIGGGQIWPLLYREDYNEQNPYAKVFYASVMEPYKMILRNSLHTEDAIKKITKNISFHCGYNAKTREYENLMLSGILDPIIVSIGAIENAVSIAMTILNTECLIVETHNQ